MERKKKTIQDIKPGVRKISRASSLTVKHAQQKPSPVVEEKIEKNERNFSPIQGKGARKNSPMIWVIALVSLCALFVAFSTLFVGATITVTPKSIPFSLDKELFTAEKDSTGTLAYQTMVVAGLKTLPVDTKESKETSSRAEGTVTIFNAFSSKLVNLLIDTRLESPKGIIYKTKKAVAIPGLKIENGTTIPGQINVDVYADIAGTQGNDSLTDFVVLGFKGTPKETKIYGRSTTPLTGGIVGLVHTVSSEEYKTSYESLRHNLENDLQEKLRAEVPERFFIVPGSIAYTTTNIPTEPYGENATINLLEEGSLSAYIIDREQLSSKIAEGILGARDAPYDVIIPEIEKLNFTIEPSSEKDIDKLFIRISGESEIVWNIDAEKIAYDTRATYRRQFSA